MNNNGQYDKWMLHFFPDADSFDRLLRSESFAVEFYNDPKRFVEICTSCDLFLPGEQERNNSCALIFIDIFIDLLREFVIKIDGIHYEHRNNANYDHIDCNLWPIDIDHGDNITSCILETFRHALLILKEIIVRGYIYNTRTFYDKVVELLEEPDMEIFFVDSMVVLLGFSLIGDKIQKTPKLSNYNMRSLVQSRPFNWFEITALNVMCGRWNVDLSVTFCEMTLSSYEVRVCSISTDYIVLTKCCYRPTQMIV